MNLIAVGIKNAIERGENVELAAQSFINAGYNQEDVRQAVSEINSLIQNQQFSQNIPQQSQMQPVQSSYPNLNPPDQSRFKSLPSTSSFEMGGKKQYLFYFLISLAGIIILACAALLGLYWNNLFK